MSKTYVVWGQTGEYEYRENWTVKAFKSERRARNLIVRATQEAKKIYRRKGHNHKNKYDKNYCKGTTATTYYYDVVDYSE